MSVRVLDEGHPQIVIRHRRDQMWRREDRNALGAKLVAGKSQVGDAEVHGALARGDPLAILGRREHQAHARAVEKAEIAVAVELPQPQHAAVKGFGGIRVAYRNGDLAELTESHDAILPWRKASIA